MPILSSMPSKTLAVNLRVSFVSRTQQPGSTYRSLPSVGDRGEWSFSPRSSQNRQDLRSFEVGE